MRISLIFCPNYLLKSKGRYNLDLRTNYYIRWKNMKGLPEIYQVATHFHPGHLQLQTLINSFSVLTLNCWWKWAIIFRFLMTQMYFWLFKQMTKIYDSDP